ncbi:MAG: hypothetical protein HYS07_04100 [Chlamydiae bacterium]|nr:hypothetical protein [Chlamydiota bacterium]MBI3277381.1 hypothetical protein [Chlamydiota bacterium]
MKFLMVGFILSVMLMGCSDFEDPTKKASLETIVGGGPSLNQGMTKDEVLNGWGVPDEKKPMGETRWGASIERWAYYGRFPDVPIDYKYVSKGRYLFFEGDALVRWEVIEEEKMEEREEPKDKKDHEPSTNP